MAPATRRGGDVVTIPWNVLGVLVGLVALVAGVWWLLTLPDTFREHCEAAGGHVISKNAVGTGVSASGRPVVTTTTIRWCLTPDGRVLDVE